jgi:hypothetical protein
VEEHHLLLQEEHEHRADRDERGGEGVHHLRTTVGGGRGDEVWRIDAAAVAAEKPTMPSSENISPPDPDRAFRRVGRQ